MILFTETRGNASNKGPAPSTSPHSGEPSPAAREPSSVPGPARPLPPPPSLFSLLSSSVTVWKPKCISGPVAKPHCALRAPEGPDSSARRQHLHRSSRTAAIFGTAGAGSGGGERPGPRSQRGRTATAAFSAAQGDAASAGRGHRTPRYHRCSAARQNLCCESERNGGKSYQKNPNTTLTVYLSNFANSFLQLYFL